MQNEHRLKHETVNKTTEASEKEASATMLLIERHENPIVGETQAAAGVAPTQVSRD